MTRARDLANLGDGVRDVDVPANAAINSSKFAFSQAGVSAATRTVESKLRDVVSVKDFGAVGDGVTDDTAAIQAANAAAAAAGVPLVLPDGRYSVVSISLTTAEIYSAGAILEPSAAGSALAAAVVVGGSVRQIDALNIEQANTVRKRCIVLNACHDLSIGQITVKNSSQNSDDNSYQNAAIRIVGCVNTRIGYCGIEKWDRPVLALGSNENLSVGTVRIRSYICGINIRQGINISLGASGGLDIQELSPLWTGIAPGQCGILVGNESGVDAGTSHIKIHNPLISDSGEHGVRIAGAHEIHHVLLEQPHITNAGSAGIKILNGDDGLYTRYVTINQPVIQDCAGYGLMIYRTHECTINSPRIHVVNNTYSSYDGISIYDVLWLNITDVTVKNAERHGIGVRSSHPNAALVEIIRDCDQVLVSSGTISLCGGDGINIPTQGSTHRRWNVSDILLQYNSGYGLNINSNNTPTAGQVDYGWFSTSAVGNSLGHASVSSGQTAKLNFALRGQYSAGLSCANGSTQQDTENGVFYLRKAGAWVAV